MNALLSPDTLVFTAGAAFVFGYLLVNQVLLRVMMLIGTSFYIAYYATVAEEPLWNAIYVSLAMGTANLIGLCILLTRRSALWIPRAHRDIYQNFTRLPPVEFRRLINMAHREVLKQDKTLTIENAPVTDLYFVLSGATKVQKLGENFELPPMIFIGEVAYVTGAQSSATTTLTSGSEVLRWKISDLRDVSNRKPQFRLALDAMITGDLAAKVGRAIAPSEASITAAEGRVSKA